MVDHGPESVRVTVLVDNRARQSDLLAEHGLSLLIEAGSSRVLFDTGQGTALEHNAERLGVSLADIDAIVISHGHYDHTGGLARIMAGVPAARVFVHPHAVRPHMSRREDGMRAIGIGEDAREALLNAGPRVTWTPHPAEVGPGLWVTGAIPRRSDLEDAGGPFFLDEGGKVPDPVEDDQAMWIEAGAGLVVVLGCAHAGVMNTLDHVAEQTGLAEVHAVIGGMHLGRAGAERLAATASRLAHYKVSFLAPCHCTGEASTDYLRTHFRGKFAACATGDVLLV